MSTTVIATWRAITAFSSSYDLFCVAGPNVGRFAYNSFRCQVPSVWTQCLGSTSGATFFGGNFVLFAGKNLLFLRVYFFVMVVLRYLLGFACRLFYLFFSNYPPRGESYRGNGPYYGR